MLEAIRRNAKGWLAYVIVGLICIPFALWGIGDYLGYTKPPAVATVNGDDIQERELEVAYQRFKARQQDNELFNTLDENVIKQQLLERLIVERVLQTSAAEDGFKVSDQSLMRNIASWDEFKEDGEFSLEKFSELIRLSGYSESSFLNQLRKDIIKQQIKVGLQQSAFTTAQQLAQTYELLEQKRDVVYGLISKEQFDNEVKVDTSEAQLYYDKNKELFQTEEQVAIEYVEIKKSDLPDPSVTQNEISEYYAENESDFVTPEKRDVAHILLSESQIEENPNLASEIITAHNEGESFEVLAKTHSRDVATSKQGGQLGTVGFDELPEDFSKAAFSLKTEGLVSNAITTEFGIHIIKVQKIHPAVTPSLNDVSTKIKEIIIDTKKDDLFIEKREVLADLAYRDPDTLSEVSKTLETKIIRSDYFNKDGGEGILNHPKVINAAFSESVFDLRENSEVLEIDPNHLMVIRIAEHIPVETLAFDSVKEQIFSQLKNEALITNTKLKAEAIAQTMNVKGKLDQAEAGYIAWNSEQTIARGKSEIDQILLRAIFAADPDSFETYQPLRLSNGDYAVYSVKRLTKPNVEDEEENTKKYYLEAVQRNQGMLDHMLYLESLESVVDVERKSL